MSNAKVIKTSQLGPTRAAGLEHMSERALYHSLLNPFRSPHCEMFI